MQIHPDRRGGGAPDPFSGVIRRLTRCGQNPPPLIDTSVIEPENERAMTMNFRWLIALGFCLLWDYSRAGQLAVGDPVPVISARDQHGREFVLGTNVQFVLVVTERACAQSANRQLAAASAGFLEKHAAVYLLDIHTMPAVARWFALAKMRQYPQRIVLVDSAKTLAVFPAQSNCVTVLALTPAGRVRKISFWNPAREPVAAYLK